jgi:hypothetical protein
LEIGVQPGADTEQDTEYDDVSDSVPNYRNYSPTPFSNDSNVSEPAPWKIIIEFGEVELTLFQDRSEAEIKLTKGSVYEPTYVTVNPGAADKTRSNMGENSYSLTFIPVWNGVLFSDSAQASQNFGNKVTYVQKNPKIKLSDMVQKIMRKDENDAPPRWGADGEQLPEFEWQAANGGDAETIKAVEVTSFDAGDGSQGIPESSIKTDFGDHIKVHFFRCGGAIHFKPIYFTDQGYAHYIRRGEIPVEVDDDNGPDPWDQALVWNLPEVPCTHAVPVFYRNSNEFTQMHQGAFRLNEAKETDPIDCFTFGFRRKNNHYRRPVEFWGYLLLTIEDPDNEAESLALDFVNSDMRRYDDEMRSLKKIIYSKNNNAIRRKR